MTDDGYPDETELEEIETFSGNWHQLLARVKELWWAPDWGWSEQDIEDGTVREYSVSTGGWSGNEDLIYALEHNWMFWPLNWYSNRRGGHYIFRVKK